MELCIGHQTIVKVALHIAPDHLWPKKHRSLPLFPHYPIKSELAKELDEVKFVDLTSTFSMREYLRYALDFLVKSQDFFINNRKKEEEYAKIETLIKTCIHILDSSMTKRGGGAIIKKFILQQIAENTFKLDRSLGYLAYFFNTKKIYKSKDISLNTSFVQIDTTKNPLIVRGDENDETIMQQFYNWHRKTFEYRFVYVHYTNKNIIIQNYYESYKGMLESKGVGSPKDLLFMESFIDSLGLYWEPRLKIIVDKINLIKALKNISSKPNTPHRKQLDIFTSNCINSIANMRTKDDDNIFDDHIRKFSSYLKSKVISTDCNVEGYAFAGLNKISLGKRSSENILGILNRYKGATDEYFRAFNGKYPSHQDKFNTMISILEGKSNNNNSIITCIKELEQFLKENVFYMIPFEM